jgi:DNA-binding transcriptional LysR family regulator
MEMVLDHAVIRDPDLIDLRLFICIAETNSLTRGAERVNISAPAASVRIRNLEDRFGTKLLDRTNHGVTLTPSGQAFLHRARLVSEQLLSLRDDIKEYALGLKGHLRITANPTGMAESLPSVLRLYMTAHPQIKIDLRERMSSDVVRAVSDGTADIGLVGSPLRTETLEVVPYLSDRLVLVTSKQHPLAGLPSVKLADTLDFDFIGMPENSAIHGLLLSVAEPRSKHIKTNVWVSDSDAFCRMVEADIGVGITSERAAHRHALVGAIKIIPLEDKSAQRDLSICARSFAQLPAFAKDFVDMLQKTGDSIEQPALKLGR